MSNSLIRSLGLNPKDHAIVNVQKLLKAFQNKEQAQQFESVKNRPQFQEEILGKQVANIDTSLNEQYAFGLDTSMVNFMGQQAGFDEEQLNNLQRQFVQIKQDNSFNQVLQGAPSPNTAQNLPFSPPSLDLSQKINFPFPSENLLSPQTRNTETGLEDIFAQLCSQQNNTQLEVPQILSHRPSQRNFLQQLQQSQQLSQQNSMHNNHLSHQNSQISQRLLASVQQQGSINQSQLSHQSSFQDGLLFANSQRQNNGLQVFNPENSGNMPYPITKNQDMQLQPNLMYDFLEDLAYKNSMVPNDLLSPGGNVPNFTDVTLQDMQLRQHLLYQQLLPQIQDQQLQLLNYKTQNSILTQQPFVYPELLEKAQLSQDIPQIFDNQLQLKPAISVSKTTN